MPDGISSSVQDALSEFLQVNDAVLVDFVCSIRYIRSTEDGSETYKAFSVAVSDDFDPFVYPGHVQLLAADSETYTRAMFEES